MLVHSGCSRVDESTYLGIVVRSAKLAPDGWPDRGEAVVGDAAEHEPSDAIGSSSSNVSPSGPREVHRGILAARRVVMARSIDEPHPRDRHRPSERGRLTRPATAAGAPSVH
jgi:hypothetical protein